MELRSQEVADSSDIILLVDDELFAENFFDQK
jgi:hypothetical protein